MAAGQRIQSAIAAAVPLPLLQPRDKLRHVAAIIGSWVAMMVELYHNNVSVCAQKVRIVLAEKDVPWTNHHLSLAMGEHLTPQFKAMNPRGYGARA